MANRPQVVHGLRVGLLRLRAHQAQAMVVPTDALLAAANDADRYPETDRHKLLMPATVPFGGSCLWVGEFKSPPRILRFSPRQQASAESC